VGAPGTMTENTGSFSAPEGAGAPPATFNCLNCGATAFPEAYLMNCTDRYQRTAFKADYYSCKECGLVQMHPLPVNVSALYESYPVHRDKAPLHNLARRLVMRPAYFDIRGAAPGSVLLDYGCGDGWFLESCKGRQVSLLGFEPSRPLAERLSARLNLAVYWNPDRLICDHRCKVDVVTMHFVLEHLTGLAQAFGHVNQLLTRRGLFFFTVPNLDSWEARLFGKKWHGLDPPRHVSFPHGAVVQQLAHRHGLRVLRARPVAFPNGFAGSCPVALAGHFNFVLYLLALPLGILLSRAAPSGTFSYLLQKASP